MSRIITYSRKYIKEILIAIAIFFKQSAKLISEKYSTLLGGNVDPFFLVGLLYLIKNRSNKEKIKEYLLYIIPILIFAILQFVLLFCFFEVSLLKMTINILKICLCISTLLYIKQNYKSINIKKIIYIFTYINLIFMIIALILRNNSFLWRTNDLVNGYSKTRLQLFFLEPSELGFHIAIIMIFITAFILNSEKKEEKLKYLMCLIINAICLFLAKSMGAICILLLSVVFMLIHYLFKRNDKKKMLIYTFILLIGLILLSIILIKVKNPIAMRVIDTVNGKDSSNNYRIGVSVETLKKSLKDYYLLGCGFGNINTPQFISRYSLHTVIVNSFIYFWIEAGLFGIVGSAILIYKLFKACYNSKSALKWGLFTFLIIYQFLGSHFVSPLNWALYGLIFSNYNEKEGNT